MATTETTTTTYDVGKLGEPYKNLPELYTTKAFDADAYRQQALKEKYGTDASRRDIRRFNRYMDSDEGNAALEAARAEHLKTENDKSQASYAAYARAISEQSHQRMLNAKAEWDAKIAELEAKAKPQVTVKNADYWNRVAKKYGFDDYNAVAAWQQDNGLKVDGMFGDKSYAKWAQLNPDKVGSTPVIKPAIKPRPTTPAASTVPAGTSTPAGTGGGDEYDAPPGYQYVSRPDGTTVLIKSGNTPATKPVASTVAQTTPKTKGFNFTALAADMKSKYGTGITNIGGKNYVRYDPNGFGDYYIGDDGSLYKADMGGDLGDKLTKYDGTKNYRLVTDLRSKYYHKQGGTMKRINYFGGGGPAKFGFQSDTLSVGPNRKIISQSFYPLDANGRPVGDWEHVGGRVKSVGPDGERIEYFDEPADYIDSDKGFMPVGYANDQDAAKARFMERLRAMGSSNPDAQKVQAEMKGKYQQGGAVAPQQDMQQQVVALVQAAMQGDEKAVQTVNQIMEAAKAGDPQATQIAQLMEQVVKQMQGQATAAKYGAKLSYLQSLKCGGKTKAKKRQNGGPVCPDCEKQSKLNKKPLISRHQSGGSFYQNWSKGDIIKLQQFLSREDMLGDAAYKGDYDGKLGPQTIAAIKAYQKKHNITADGMWGYNTNQFHRVVDSGILNKGKYSPNHKTEQGDNVTYDVAGKRMTEREYYKAVQQLKERFYKDPEAFWKDNGEMSKWRQHLYTTPEGTAIMEEFYSATPDDVKAKIDPKKLSTKIQSAQFNKDIREGMDEAADFGVKKVLPVVGTIMNPVAAASGFAGAGIGGWLGGNFWHNLHAGEERYNDIATDELGNQAVVVMVPEQERYAQGSAVGQAVGGGIGAWLSGFFGRPSLDGARAEWGRSPQLWNRKATLATYKPPTTVRSDYGGTHATRRGGNGPVIEVQTEPHINFENLSQRKANGGLINRIK